MQADCTNRTSGSAAGKVNLASFGERLRSFVREIRDATGVPGIGAGVSSNGRRIFACAGTLSSADATPLTEDTRFHLGCITKSLLAAVALERARAGALELRAPLGEYLPELGRTRVGRCIQVAHLLSHTSGYQGTNPLAPGMRNVSWEAFVDYLRHAPQFFAPGAVFNYEHSEAVILAQILRRATTQSGAELIRRDLFEPLGLLAAAEGATRDTHAFAGHNALDARTRSYRPVVPAPFGRFWHAAFSAAGVSLRDLLRLSEAAMGVSARAGSGPISDWARSRLHTPVVHLPHGAGGPLAEMLPVAFGLGAAVLRDGFFGSTGVAEGQSIGMRYDPAAASSVVVAINARLPHLRDFVLDTVCRHLTGRARRARGDQPFGFHLRELAGVYRGAGDARVYAAVEGKRLTCLIAPRGRADGLRVELGIDGDGRSTVYSTLPQLSIGFFRETSSGDIGLMLGLNAYKRVGHDERADRKGR